MPRTPYDGQPLYCEWCGDIWDTSECAAAGSWCCELESEAEAQKRMHEHEEPAQ